MAKKARKPRVKKPKKEKTIDEMRMLLLRRASYRWTYKYQAMAAAKIVVDDGFYKNGNPKTKTLFKCAKCTEYFGSKQVQADHIVEIGAVKQPGTDLIDWNHHIPALLCEKSGYQCLCKPCHKEKTALYLGKKAKSKKKA